MANVLVLGVGPLPIDQGKRLYAPGMRTWHIVKLLEARRHHVFVGLIQFGEIKGDGAPGFAPRLEEVNERIRTYQLKYHPCHTAEALATLHSRLKFSCIISTTDIMNSVAADVPARVPLWLDYNGDPFAEKQLQGSVYGNDVTLLDQWKMMLKGLLAGDRFSTASTPQKHALVGQLGFAGRLNQFTAGEDLVVSVPNCSRAIRDLGLPRNFSIKGTYVPASAFVVLWTGGYNTWADPVTLFHGLEAAIRKNPSIYFVSTGGEIEGHDNRTFRRFRSLADGSEQSKHFHFLGWRETEEMPAFYRQADAAIVADRACYEGELGARTRINDWLEFRVPVIAGEQCEMTRDLAARNLAYTFRVGDAESLAAAVLAAADDPEAAEQRAEQARDYFNTGLAEEKVFAPMLDWADAPCFAGDRRLAEAVPQLPLRVTVDCAFPRVLAAMLEEREEKSDASGQEPAWRRLLGKVLGS